MNSLDSMRTQTEMFKVIIIDYENKVMWITLCSYIIGQNIKTS